MAGCTEVEILRRRAVEGKRDVLLEPKKFGGVRGTSIGVRFDQDGKVAGGGVQGSGYADCGDGGWDCLT